MTEDIKTVALTYTGGKGRHIIQRYNGSDPVTGEPINCDVDSPKTCLVHVSEKKAFQLLTDFPNNWEGKLPEELKGKIEDYQTKVIQAGRKLPEPTKSEKKKLKGGNPSWNWAFEKLYAWAKSNDPEMTWEPIENANTMVNKKSLWEYINEFIIKK